MSYRPMTLILSPLLKVKESHDLLLGHTAKRKPRSSMRRQTTHRNQHRRMKVTTITMKTKSVLKVKYVKMIPRKAARQQLRNPNTTKRRSDEDESVNWHWKAIKANRSRTTKMMKCHRSRMAQVTKFMKEFLQVTSMTVWLKISSSGSEASAIIFIGSGELVHWTQASWPRWFRWRKHWRGND